MVSNERETGQQTGHVCPACRQPVETAIKRRKILGAFVPVWGPGACRNPDCPAHIGEPDRTEPEPRA